MKLEGESLLKPATPLPAIVAPGWRIALPLVVAAIVVILGIYWRTAESIVAIWWRSETFAHGFLIVPISVVLIWMRRREVAKLTPSVDYLGLLLLAGAGLAWLLAAAGRAQVVQQYAMVAMIPAAVIAIAGRHVAGAIAFPLVFLFLGVPIGEFLIEPLMDRTADFTVAALQLTGIPVYREGTFFNIPSGDWSIVEGCSGLRYLIASVTVGLLYAYLTYRTTTKRVLFTAASIVVPIVANWLRAYMIVMIAHLSDMRLALGIDHYIYGWVFFGLVMLLLFWIGSFWRDESAVAAHPEPAPASAHNEMGTSAAAFASASRIAAASVTTVAIAAAWPLYAAHLDRSIEARGPLRLDVPAPTYGWELAAEPATDWRPRYQGAPASIFQTYRKGDQVVVLYVGLYRQQRRDAELVTSQNIIVVQKHPVWSNVGETRHTEDFGKGSFALKETRLRSVARQQRLLVWDWFRVSGHEFTNHYLGKLLLAQDKLLDRGDDGAAIIVATPYEDKIDRAAETLRQFMREMGPSIDAELARAAAQQPADGT